jgi:hypothetical protein
MSISEIAEAWGHSELTLGVELIAKISRKPCRETSREMSGKGVAVRSLIPKLIKGYTQCSRLRVEYKP